MVEAVVDAVDDGAVGEERGEAAPARASSSAASPADVQEALLLAGEARLRQILGGRARADRHRRLIGPGLARERPYAETIASSRPAGSGADSTSARSLAPRRGQRGHVLAGHPFEDGGEPVAQAVAVEERPVGVRGDRESVGNANPGRAELAVELTERRRLAADQGHVSQPDLPEPLDGLTRSGAPRSGRAATPCAPGRSRRRRRPRPRSRRRARSPPERHQRRATRQHVADRVASRDPERDADQRRRPARASPPRSGTASRMSRRARPDRHAQADLPRALGHRDQHDVHDADAADQQRDRRRSRPGAGRHDAARSASCVWQDLRRGCGS